MHPNHARFLEGLSIVPMVVCDAVAGDDGAGSINALPAMDEDGPSGGIIEESENGGDLLVGRGAEARHRHAHVVHAGCFHEFLLRSTIAFAAEIDHGSDTHLRQALEPLRFGLCTTIDVCVHLMEVVDSGNIEIGGSKRQRKAEARQDGYGNAGLHADDYSILARLR